MLKNCPILQSIVSYDIEKASEKSSYWLFPKVTSLSSSAGKKSNVSTQ